MVLLWISLTALSLLSPIPSLAYRLKDPPKSHRPALTALHCLPSLSDGQRALWGLAVPVRPLPSQSSCARQGSPDFPLGQLFPFGSSSPCGPISRCQTGCHLWGEDSSAALPLSQACLRWVPTPLTSANSSFGWALVYLPPQSVSSQCWVSSLSPQSLVGV